MFFSFPSEKNAYQVSQAVVGAFLSDNPSQPGDCIFEVTKLSSRAQAFVSSFYIVNLLSEKRYIAPRNVAISKSNRVLCKNSLKHVNMPMKDTQISHFFTAIRGEIISRQEMTSINFVTIYHRHLSLTLSAGQNRILPVSDCI